MVIRRFTLQDREGIHRLLGKRETFNDKEIEVALEVLDAALRCPEKGDYRVFCAVQGAELLAGYICFGPIPLTDNCFDLYWIAVDERYSRQGIGGRLLQFMERLLQEEKARRIYVDTSSTDPYRPARAFYERHGYRLVCVLEDFYRAGDHKMIFMKEL
jgi:ribosomal protein S18 acetylase RimI-like enzyme